jgi:sulfur-oxidizing protein SoxY
MTNDMRGAITRRRVLGTLGVLGASAASGALAITWPHDAAAQTFGQQETVDDALKRLFAGRPLKDAGNLVKLDVPLIAENGAAVKVEVEATSPMTAANHVRHIYVIADKNRIPVITRVALSPASGQAYMAANVRLGESGDVRAIVEQSDGTLLQIKREVKVTVGGCGG